MNFKTNESVGWSPSPLNGERAGVRGEILEKALILQALGEARPPRLTLPPPLNAERVCLRPPVGYPSVLAVTPRSGFHGRRRLAGACQALWGN
jgi:hypothetical protein